MKSITSFLKQTIKTLNSSSLDIKNIEVKYIGQKLFNDKDIIESRLYFKKHNACNVIFSLLISVDTVKDFYNSFKNNDKDIMTIEDFFDYFINLIINSIICTYNRRHPRRYIKQYIHTKDDISNDIYKKYIYQIEFKYNGKKEYIFFNINPKKNIF